MNSIYKKIKLFGGRLTKTKKAIIDTLFENRCLLPKAELIRKLKVNNIKPNRSTIYRELKFLTKSNIVFKNTIAGIDYYEIPQEHHHHFICIGCNLIQKVKMRNYLEKKEKQIVKEGNFNIINHSLEFYGYCNKCKL
jgi:Fe2+ or Zn2+ uptake regulation protein